jgi:hypothetical protein
LGIFPCLSLLHALTANIIQPFPIWIYTSNIWWACAAKCWLKTN